MATPLAESPIDPVHDTLTIIEQTLAVHSRFEPPSATGTFSVVASGYVALMFLGPRPAQMALEAPEVRLHSQHDPAHRRLRGRPRELPRTS